VGTNFFAGLGDTHMTAELPDATTLRIDRTPLELERPE
jgi:hypothetical protein